jgi:hypothetical protein
VAKHVEKRSFIGQRGSPAKDCSRRGQLAPVCFESWIGIFGGHVDVSGSVCDYLLFQATSVVRMLFRSRSRLKVAPASSGFRSCRGCAAYLRVLHHQTFARRTSTLQQIFQNHAKTIGSGEAGSNCRRDR